MDRLFFPLLWWIPDFPNDEVTVGPFTLLKRKWEVSIFDLYSLVAQKHSVKFPAEVANVFLPHVNCEIGVEHNGDFEATCVMLDVLRAMLYTDCQSPTVAPYASNYSLNSYAGINDRSSSLLRERMHEGLREGITTATSTVTMQAFEPSFVCMRGNNSGRLKLDAESFHHACKRAETWINIEKTSKHARAARNALVKAPLIPDIGSSLLQIWQGIESLFPDIGSELTFRVSLMLCQHTSSIACRQITYKESRRSYADRSNVAHGSRKTVDEESWQRAWCLLCLAIRAATDRQKIPTEEELISELLREVRVQESC